MKSVLVTGATGAIGPRVVQALHQEGYRVRTFSIDAPGHGMFPHEVEVRAGDVTDREAVRSALKGMDAVIHMAALLHVVNPPVDMFERYDRINVGGSSAVIEAGLREGVERVILLSTIAVYGQSHGQVLSELSPPQPETFYARTKLSAEQMVLNARRADGQSLGTVLRLGAVYGSRIKGNYERMTHALARNRFISIGNGLNRRTLIYDKDVGKAVVMALAHPAAAGKIFNVTDGGFHSINEILASICSALGRRVPRWSLPVGTVRSSVVLVEKGCGFLGLKPPVTHELVDKYIEDIAVDGSLIQKEIGFAPQYDLMSGWEETIGEMRNGGLI
jgi:UDP-glucose 4-epimerase